MHILYWLHQFDRQLFIRVFNQGERRMIRPAAKALSRSADGYLYLLVPLLLWLAGAENLDNFLSLLLTALLLERAVYWLLKNGLRRNRPQDAMPGFASLIVAGDKFSFPSGHTSAAFLLTTCLTLVYSGPFLTMYAWAVAIGFSRVLLGVHSPGDTVAGAIMGTGIALLSASQLGVY